jgi:uncharacterized membrane protein
VRHLSWPKRIALVLASCFYIGAGILHFTKTAFYLKIMPPYIPWHLAMVQISGVCEILGGIGLLIPQTRRASAWGLVALLIAVFPANVYMVTDPVAAGAAAISPLVLWGRLPLQLFLVFWVLWVTRPAIVPEHGRVATS